MSSTADLHSMRDRRDSAHTLRDLSASEMEPAPAVRWALRIDFSPTSLKYHRSRRSVVRRSLDALRCDDATSKHLA